MNCNPLQLQLSIYLSIRFFLTPNLPCLHSFRRSCMNQSFNRQARSYRVPSLFQKPNFFMLTCSHIPTRNSNLGPPLPALPSTLKSSTFLYPLLVVFAYNMTKPPKPATASQGLIHSQYPVFPSETHLTDACLEKRHTSAFTY